MKLLTQYVKIHPCDFTCAPGEALYQHPKVVGDLDVLLEWDSIQKSVLHFTARHMTFTSSSFRTQSSLNCPYHYLRVCKI